MNLDLRILARLPRMQKILLSVIAVAIQAAIFYTMVYSARWDRKTQLGQERVQLQQQIVVDQMKADRLEALTQMNQELQRRLAELTHQLPSAPEIPALLEQVSALAAVTGLDIMLWRPVAQRASPTGLYVEVPVTVEARGGYHALGSFLDRVNRLPRIVRIADLKLSSPQEGRAGMTVKISFVTTTFTAPQETGG